MSLLPYHCLWQECTWACWNYSTPFQAPNGWAQPPDLPKIKRYNGTTYRFSMIQLANDGKITYLGHLGALSSASAAGFHEVLEVHALACLKALVNSHCAMRCHAYCHLDKPHTSIITSSYTINYNAHLCAKPCLKDRIQSLLVFCHVRSQLQKGFLSSTGAQSPVLPQPTWWTLSSHHPRRVGSRRHIQW